MRFYSFVKTSSIFVACGGLVPHLSSSLFSAHTAMATVVDICQELSDIDKFYMSRSGSASATHLLTNMIAGVVAKIASLQHFDVRTAMTLIDALDKLAHTTRMSPSLVQQVQDSIDARMTTATAQLPTSVVAHKSRGGGVTQELRAPYNFLTASDVTGLRDIRANTMTMVNIVAQRLRLLGVKNPHEQTIKYGVAMIVSVLSDKLQQFPSYESIYNIVNDLKAAIDAAGKRPYPVTPPIVYPETSEELRTLHPAVFAHAYAHGDPPVATAFDRLHMITSHIPLRSNNKLLKGKPGATSSQMGGDVADLLNELRGLVNRDDRRDVPMTIVGSARMKHTSADGAAVGRAHAICDTASASAGQLPVPCGAPLALRDVDREPAAFAHAASPADRVPPLLPLPGASMFKPVDVTRGRTFGSLEAPAPVAQRMVAHVESLGPCVSAAAISAGSSVGVTRATHDVSAPAGGDAGSVGPSVEDFEKAAFDALKGRNAKRAAQANAAKQQARAKAKAAAVTAKAAAVTGKADTSASSKAVDVMTATSRNSFSSTAYNKAYRESLAKTKSKVKAKSSAKAAYKKAGELWAKKRS